MQQHSHFHLWIISKIQPIVSVTAADTLVHAFVSSQTWLMWNTILYNLISQLQPEESIETINKNRKL